MVKKLWYELGLVLVLCMKTESLQQMSSFLLFFQGKTLHEFGNEGGMFLKDALDELLTAVGEFCINYTSVRRTGTPLQEAPLLEFVNYIRHAAAGEQDQISERSDREASFMMQGLQHSELGKAETLCLHLSA